MGANTLISVTEKRSPTAPRFGSRVVRTSMLCVTAVRRVAAGGKPITSSYDKEDLKVSAAGIDVNRRYRTTNVWMKRQGRWQIVAAHTGFVLSPKQAASLAGEAS